MHHSKAPDASNSQVLRPPNTSGVSNAGVGSSISPRSLWAKRHFRVDGLESSAGAPRRLDGIGHRLQRLVAGKLGAALRASRGGLENRTMTPRSSRFESLESLGTVSFLFRPFS